MTTVNINNLVGKMDTVDFRHALYEVNVSGGYRAVCKIGSAKMYAGFPNDGVAIMRTERDKVFEAICEVLNGINVLTYEVDTDYMEHGKKYNIVIKTIQGKKREDFDMVGTITYLGTYDMKPLKDIR